LPFGSETGAVEVEDLSVHYRTVLHKRPTFKRALREGLAGRRVVQFVKALDGVSFTIERGSTYAVIGRNGAGKTTLLRVIAGIIPPTAGQVAVRGRVSTLLALGVGFNTDLTGRDNIFLGGLAAGVDHRELEEAFDEIVAFSELERFIDFPMRSYSSGMRGRLAFSVAVHVRPELLLIDEALSTGDEAFREKCKLKMQDLCRRDTTIVLVTHGLKTVEDLATECLWLHQGRVEKQGDPEEVVAAYREFAHAQSRGRSVPRIS
jgi:ABC-type polysaccharide/polyol phosphate transport system ATPase subunit